MTTVAAEVTKSVLFFFLSKFFPRKGCFHGSTSSSATDYINLERVTTFLFDLHGGNKR